MELQEKINKRIEELNAEIRKLAPQFMMSASARISEKINENGRVIQELKQLLN